MRRVLFIGNHRYDDFQAAVAWLERHTRLTVCADLTRALALVRKPDLRPELIVLAQSHPWQFAKPAIELLAGRAPLARFVSLLGSWCESETRTGEPCPGAVRLYWHQFTARVSSALRQADQEADGVWTLPRTSTYAEQCLALSTTSTGQADGRLIAIRSGTLAAYQAVADALRSCGFATTWVSPRQPPFGCGQWAGIWDSDLLSSADTDQLQAFAAWLHPAPAIVLMNFPRWSDWRRLHSLGVSAVLGKPWILSDLTSILARAAKRTGEVSDGFAA